MPHLVATLCVVSFSAALPPFGLDHLDFGRGRFIPKLRLLVSVFGRLAQKIFNVGLKLPRKLASTRADIHSSEFPRTKLTRHLGRLSPNSLGLKVHLFGIVLFVNELRRDSSQGIAITFQKTLDTCSSCR